jgi:hypothetical protein
LNALRIHPELRYCVDPFDIKLFRPGRNQTIVLRHPEAVVWGLLVRGYSVGQMRRLMAIIGRMTPSHAGDVVDEALQYFRSEGLLLGD